MPASADLLARVDIPKKFQGAQTPYHRENFELYSMVKPDSPTFVAGGFLETLLNPAIDIEAVATQIDRVTRRDVHTFALHGRLPTVDTGFGWWKNRSVDLPGLFKRAATDVETVGSSVPKLKRFYDVVPLQRDPYITAYEAEKGITHGQTEPLILRGIHASPFLYQEGPELKGEDHTRALVTIRTQPGIVYLDERIQEAQTENARRLAKLQYELDATQREMAREELQHKDKIHTYLTARDRLTRK